MRCYYVYAYIDPRDEVPRYMGRGVFSAELEAAQAYNDAAVDKYWNGNGYKNQIAERRVANIPVAVERRSGVERRAING